MATILMGGPTPRVIYDGNIKLPYDLWMRMATWRNGNTVDNEVCLFGKEVGTQFVEWNTYINTNSYNIVGDMYLNGF